MTAKKLWIWLGATVAASFLVLIFFGVEIYRTAPPFPEKIVTTDGETLYEGQDIKDGQNAWQSMGGQTVGSIWGHGAYIAPDWNADYLHRESMLLLDLYAIKTCPKKSKLSIRYSCAKSFVPILSISKRGLSLSRLSAHK